jgi:hypothetical protein
MRGVCGGRRRCIIEGPILVRDCEKKRVEADLEK